MLNIPLTPWPYYTQEEAEAVAAVLLSNRVNYWTGEECREFEREFADWTDTAYAIALANGTVAIDLALRAFKIGNGDEVIVTPRSFMASVSCVVNAGARPVFVDVDRDSGNMCPRSIEAMITPKTRAIIAVHLAGWPCDMAAIMDIADKHGIYVIEDCAQAHGAKYRGRSVGSIGHVGTWSFCQDKIITTGGEGGMVTTNSRELWSKMWSFKDHGKSYAAVYETQHPPGHRWVHHSFGTNWRMLETQAAMGRIQLRKMADWTHRRNTHAQTLIQVLREFAGDRGILRLPEFSIQDSIHAYYKLYCYLRLERLNGNWRRDNIIQALNENGAPCYHGSCSEIYLEKAFDETDYAPVSRLPIARELGETSMMFLVHPSLSDEDMRQYASAIHKTLSLATSDVSLYNPEQG